MADLEETMAKVALLTQAEAPPLKVVQQVAEVHPQAEHTVQAIQHSVRAAQATHAHLKAQVHNRDMVAHHQAQAAQAAVLQHPLHALLKALPLHQDMALATAMPQLQALAKVTQPEQLLSAPLPLHQPQEAATPVDLPLQLVQPPNAPLLVQALQ